MKTTTQPRLRAVATTLLATMATTGCSTPIGSDEGMIVASILSDPDQVTPQVLGELAGQAGGELRDWPLPIPSIEMGEYASVAKDGKSAFCFSYDYVGAATLLPLYRNVTLISHDDTGDSSGFDLHWNPIWSSVKPIDPAETGGSPVTGKANSLPLIYSHVGLEDKNSGLDISLMETLWVLGPSYLAGNIPLGSTGSLSGYLFSPLFTPLIWASADIAIGRRDDPGSQDGAGPGSDASSTDRVDIVGHGPLVSLLGYLSITNQEGPRTSKNRFVVGGLLWTSLSETEGGETIEAAHGPLYGLFGWGRSDGEPTIRFLWMDFVI